MKEQTLETTLIINDHEFETVVKFDYEPEQKTNWHDPCFPEKVSINSVKIKEFELPGWLLKTVEDQVIECCLEHIHVKKMADKFAQEQFQRSAIECWSEYYWQAC